MGLKDCIKELLKDTNDADSLEKTEKKIVESEKVPAEKIALPNDKVESDKKESETELEIFTASEEQIDYWHACVNIHIWDFLTPYDLNVGTTAFDSFRIGVDTENHAVTFALDETHYLKIELNDTNVRPIDKEQAEKVLRKVNSMRFEKIKDNPSLRGRVLKQVL